LLARHDFDLCGGSKRYVKDAICTRISISLHRSKIFHAEWKQSTIRRFVNDCQLQTAIKVLSNTLEQCKPTVVSMKTIFLLSVFGASLHASLAIVPVYGCEKYPQTTALTNFTFTHGTSTTNATGPSSVKWQAPALSVSCSASSSSTNSIGAPGTYTSVPCGEKPSDPVMGSFQVSANGSNATVTFITYVQCAADIFGFRWEAVIPFSCASDAAGSETCAANGNTTASVTSAGYIPHVRPPPPPPWSPRPPQSMST
jgi:hypothetical protein